MGRTLVIILVFVGLAACGGSASRPESGSDDPLVAACRDQLIAANKDAGASLLSVGRAYAAAMPAITKIALTGAVRTGTIIFKGFDDRPFLSGVPSDLRNVIRPVERAFGRIRVAIGNHAQVLTGVRKAAARCRKSAQKAGDECLEQAAHAVGEAADTNIKLARELIEVGGHSLQQSIGELEDASLELDRAGTELANEMVSVERCLTAREI